MSKSFVVNSDHSLAQFIKDVTSLFFKAKYLIITIREGYDRTLAQNRLWFNLYTRISHSTEMGDVEEVRKFCKLHFGVPILRKSCLEFREGWKCTMQHLDYEMKLKLMGSCKLYGPDGFPVTRLFNRKEGIEYTERIINYFTAREVYFDDILNEEEAKKVQES